MSSATDHDLPLDEERRSPSVSLAEVLATCHELEMAGTPITRRSVRDKLGRGSMTTIHNGVSQYESRQAPAPPSIDLTQEDRNVIADLGARALAVAEERVERVLAQREAVLQNQIIAASARADDAIAAAEIMISEAQRHTLEALATSEAARLERDRALSEAEDAKQHAFRLEGQTAQMAADKERMAAQRAAIEDELVEIKAKLAAETALRSRYEVDLTASASALKTIQAEHAEEIQEQVKQIAWVREALVAEHGRLAELLEQRRRAGETIERLENELSLREEALSQVQTDFAVIKATLAARDEATRDVAAALAAEQAKAQQLTLILKAIGEQTEAMRALEASISSRDPNQ
jgi:DNA repair exonuclease SbcCD ATPase subunit